MKKAMIVLIASILHGCAGMDAGTVLNLANTMANVAGVDTGALGSVAGLAGGYGGGLGAVSSLAGGGLGGVGNVAGLASGLTGDPMADLVIGAGVQIAAQGIASESAAANEAPASQATRAPYNNQATLNASAVPTSTGSISKLGSHFNSVPLLTNISDPIFSNLILDRIDSQNVKVYVRPSQVYFVIPLDVSKIEYYFYNDVFYRGTITVDKEVKLDRIFQHVYPVFGKDYTYAKEASVTKILWEDATSFVLISTVDTDTGFGSFTVLDKKLFNKSGVAMGFTGNLMVDLAIYAGETAPQALANKAKSKAVLPINKFSRVKPIGTEEVGFNPVTHETTYSNGNKYAAAPRKSTTYTYSATTAKANQDALKQAAAASDGSIPAALNFQVVFNRVMTDNINDPSSVNVFDIPTLTSMLQSCKSVLQSNQEMKALRPNVDFSAADASNQELISLIETTIANKKAGRSNGSTGIIANGPVVKNLNTSSNYGSVYKKSMLDNNAGNAGTAGPASPQGSVGSGTDTSFNDVYIPPTQDIGDVDGLLAKQPKNINPSNNPNYDALASGPFVKVVSACGTQQPIASVVADGPCKPEIIEYNKIACRADWPSMPQTLKMYQCGVVNSTGTRVAVNKHKVEETELWMQRASGSEGLPDNNVQGNVNINSEDIPKEVYSQFKDITPVRAPTTQCVSDGHASCTVAR